MDIKYKHLRNDREFLAALFCEGLDIYSREDEYDVDIMAELWTQDVGTQTWP